MDSSKQKKLDEIIKRAEGREAKSRKRAVYYTLIPLIVGLIFLTYSSVRIYKESAEVKRLDSLATTYENKIDTLQKQLELAEERLRESTNLQKYTHPIGYVDLKYIASRYPGAGRVLERILDLRSRGVGWHLGGFDPDVGFDSPGFAMYILNEFNLVSGLTRGNEDLLTASRALYNRLERTDDPSVGDLYFYPSGYVMFYMKDPDSEPFVIGMTPSGIIALELDFADLIGMRKSGIN